MIEEPQPLWKELPLPTEEERRLFEEWTRRREKEEEKEDRTDRVVIVDV